MAAGTHHGLYRHVTATRPDGPGWLLTLTCGHQARDSAPRQLAERVICMQCEPQRCQACGWEREYLFPDAIGRRTCLRCVEYLEQIDRDIHAAVLASDAET